MWIAVSFHEIFFINLREQFTLLVQGEYFTGEKSEKDAKFKKILLETIGLFAAVMAIQLINFFYFLPKIVIDPVWSEQITLKCGPGPLAEAFATKSLVQTGLVSIGFGAYFGLVMASYHFDCQKEIEEPVDRKEMAAVKRICIFAALLLPGGAIYGLNFVGIESEAVLLIFG